MLQAEPCRPPGLLTSLPSVPSQERVLTEVGQPDRLRKLPSQAFRAVEPVGSPSMASASVPPQGRTVLQTHLTMRHEGLREWALGSNLASVT